jgi:hypothetical protein
MNFKIKEGFEMVEALAMRYLMRSSVSGDDGTDADHVLRSRFIRRHAGQSSCLSAATLAWTRTPHFTAVQDDGAEREDAMASV